MWPILSLTILGFLSLAQTCMVEKTNATPRSPRRGKISFHFIVNNSDEPYSVFSFQINSQHVQIPLSDVSSLSCFSPNLTAGYVSKWSHLIKISWYAQWSKQAQKICLADSGIDGHGSLPPYWTPSKCSTTERWWCLFQKGFFWQEWLWFCAKTGKWALNIYVTCRHIIKRYMGTTGFEGKVNALCSLRIGFRN